MTRAERNIEKAEAEAARRAGATIYVGSRTGIAQALVPGYEYQAGLITQANQAARSAQQTAKEQSAIARGSQPSSQEKVQRVLEGLEARERKGPPPGTLSGLQLGPQQRTVSIDQGRYGGGAGGPSVQLSSLPGSLRSPVAESLAVRADAARGQGLQTQAAFFQEQLQQELLREAQTMEAQRAQALARPPVQEVRQTPRGPLDGGDGRVSGIAPPVLNLKPRLANLYASDGPVEERTASITQAVYATPAGISITDTLPLSAKLAVFGTAETIAGVPREEYLNVVFGIPKDPTKSVNRFFATEEEAKAAISRGEVPPDLFVTGQKQWTVNIAGEKSVFTSTGLVLPPKSFTQQAKEFGAQQLALEKIKAGEVAPSPFVTGPKQFTVDGKTFIESPDLTKGAQPPKDVIEETLFRAASFSPFDVTGQRQVEARNRFLGDIDREIQRLNDKALGIKPVKETSQQQSQKTTQQPINGVQPSAEIIRTGLRPRVIVGQDKVTTVYEQRRPDLKKLSTFEQIELGALESLKGATQTAGYTAALIAGTAPAFIALSAAAPAVATGVGLGLVTTGEIQNIGRSVLAYQAGEPGPVAFGRALPQAGLDVALVGVPAAVRVLKTPTRQSIISKDVSSIATGITKSVETKYAGAPTLIKQTRQADIIVRTVSQPRNILGFKVGKPQTNIQAFRLTSTSKGQATDALLIGKSEVKAQPLGISYDKITVEPSTFTSRPTLTLFGQPRTIMRQFTRATPSEALTTMITREPSYKRTVPFDPLKRSFPATSKQDTFKRFETFSADEAATRSLALITQEGSKTVGTFSPIITARTRKGLFNVPEGPTVGIAEETSRIIYGESRGPLTRLKSRTVRTPDVLSAETGKPVLDIKFIEQISDAGQTKKVIQSSELAVKKLPAREDLRLKPAFGIKRPELISDQSLKAQQFRAEQGLKPQFERTKPRPFSTPSKEVEQFSPSKQVVKQQQTAALKSQETLRRTGTLDKTTQRIIGEKLARPKPLSRTKQNNLLGLSVRTGQASRSQQRFAGLKSVQEISKSQSKIVNDITRPPVGQDFVKVPEEPRQSFRTRQVTDITQTPPQEIIRLFGGGQGPELQTPPIDPIVPILPFKFKLPSQYRQRSDNKSGFYGERLYDVDSPRQFLARLQGASVKKTVDAASMAASSGKLFYRTAGRGKILAATPTGKIFSITGRKRIIGGEKMPKRKSRKKRR